MNSRHIRGAFLALPALCALLLAAPIVRAQENAPPTSGQSGDQSAAPSAPAAQEAPGPVGGVEAYRFPGPTLGRSFIVPRFSLKEVYDTNPAFESTPGASQGDSVTSITGGFSLQWVKRYSTLSLDVSSEGILYNPQYVSNGVVQQLGVTEKISVRRWNLLFGEDFSYLPNSAFGLGGLGYLGGGTSGLPGIGGVTGFNPAQLPTQTIAAPNISQFTSASMFQAQYLINGSNSISTSATVGFLHFFGSELLDTRNLIARFGYDYSITPRDTLNFSDTATVIAYPSGLQGFTSDTVQVGYRRLLTGRLQFSVAAGPSVTHFTPMAGQSSVPGGENLVDFSVLSSLNYALRDGLLTAQYTHGVAGGSGYLVGSVADQFSGGFSRRIARTVTASFTGGFAHNHAFQQTAGTVGPSAAFNYWVAGGALSRAIGHYSSLSFSYNASRQTATTTVCVNALACGPIALIQVFGVTYNWSTRPYKLE